LIGVGISIDIRLRRDLMSHVTVGRWGNSLAIRVPSGIADATGLSDGEGVEIEAVDGDILIRRSAHSAQKRAAAVAAAESIIANRRGRRLDGLSVQELRDEGRR
jgi:antitoxin component of MazEF toxin-antitoxin module